jgi:hypothetical protein
MTVCECSNVLHLTGYKSFPNRPNAGYCASLGLTLGASFHAEQHLAAG